MIPVTNQILTRAGPVTAVPNAAEAASALAISPASDLPPVTEPSAGEAATLGRGDIGAAQDAPDRGQQRRPAAAADNPDAPQDRAVFRAKAIRLLTTAYHDDESFQRALKLGTIVIHAITEQGEPEMQPELTYALYRQGALQGTQAAIAPRAGRSVTSVGPRDFIAWWPK